MLDEDQSNILTLLFDISQLIRLNITGLGHIGKCGSQESSKLVNGLPASHNMLSSTLTS